MLQTVSFQFSFGGLISSDILSLYLSSVFVVSSQRRIKEQTAPAFNGFVSAAGHTMFVPSADDLQRAKRWEEELERDMAKTIGLHSERPSLVDQETCAHLERVHRLEKQQRSQKISQQFVSFASPHATRFHVQMSTPRPPLSSSQFSVTQEVSAAVNAVIHDSEFFLSQLPVSPIEGREALLERKIKRQALVCNPRRNMLLSRVSQQKRVDLIQALKEESERETKKPFKSEFIAKKLGSRKVSLRDTFASITAEEEENGIGNWDLKALPAFCDLLKFQFDALEFLSNDQIVDYFGRGIPVAHFHVPMTHDFYVGADELELSFLSAPGIDRRLIVKGWFANALKFVLWKVISMDLQLPVDQRGQILTLENVLNELHYRYYEEIDRSRRSILRQCLEMDETPAQLMVLMVSDVMVGGQVELSDGHYAVRAEVDECLERQVERGKLRRGTKVIVDSAEFVNLHEGCAPLEVAPSVALRIHGNSTRRCRWDTRLGRYYARRRGRRRRLQVSLGGVDAKGGTISAMDVLVIRKYPLLFVTENRHRNERMHCRYRQEVESRHYNLFERLHHKVDQELREEEEEAEQRDRRGKQIPEYETVEEVKDVEELWYILNSRRHSKLSEDQLGKEQRQKLSEFREEKARRRKETIKTRVEQLMEKGLSTPSALLRIKVTDLKSPSLDRCAELWIWNVVDDEVGCLIKEGAAIHVENVLTMGMRNNVLNLKGGRKFAVREAKERSATDEKVGFGSLPVIHRRLTRLSEMTDTAQFRPTFLEFDVVVIIVKVAVRKDKFQNVFATDDQGNVLCLNFFMGLKEYACEDLVVAGRVIAFSNVQWRKMHMFGVPNGYIHELTVMTTNPRNEEAIREMDRLKGYLEKHTLDEVLEGVNKTHSFLRAPQPPGGGKSSPGQSPFASPVRLPKTPPSVRGSASTSVVTPGRGALQTPLIERQVNLLTGNKGSSSPAGQVPSVFQSPRTPAKIGVWSKRKLSK